METTFEEKLVALEQKLTAAKTEREQEEVFAQIVKAVDAELRARGLSDAAREEKLAEVMTNIMETLDDGKDED